MSTRICSTPGCGRSCPSVDHSRCSECIGVILRTGRPPVLDGAQPFVPEWRRRAQAKDLTGSLAA